MRSLDSCRGNNPELFDLIEILEYLAVISSGLYGVLLARSKHMDVVGACWVAFIVAFGGGTIRDVLLDRRPLFWIENEHYTWTLIAIAMLGSVVPGLPRRAERWLVLPDALGLALFSVVGARIALDVTSSPFIAMMFGLLAGSFGGVLADIVCNEIPRMFLPETPLYSVCGLAGCLLYLAMRLLRIPDSTSLPTCVVTITAFRLIAYRQNWHLPPLRQ